MAGPLEHRIPPEEQLLALGTIAESRGDRLDVDDLLGELLERIVEILHVDTAAVLLLEKRTGELIARAAHGVEEEVRQALMEPVQLILDVIKNTLEETPAELAADLVDRGIMLAGGGSLLRGLPDLIRQETELPVHRAADPLSCVALGTGKFLEELDNIQDRHPDFVTSYRYRS